MTKTLTEQWKNGELGFGYYYIDFGIGGVPMLFNGLEFYCERTQKPNAIKTILAPVPSYNHFSQLVKKVEYLQEQLDEAIKITKDQELIIKKLKRRRICTNQKEKARKEHINELIAQVAKQKEEIARRGRLINELKSQRKEANEIIANFRTYDFTRNDELAEEYQVKYGIEGEKIYTNRKPPKEFEQWRKKITKSFEKKLKSGE